MQGRPPDPRRRGLAASVAIAGLVLASFGASVPAAADSVDPTTATFHPNTVLTFDVPRLDHPPRIDGRLDDPVWRSAVHLTHFTEVEPGDNIAPPVKTDVMFAYDSDNLYIAFDCHDSDPAAIRASITDRDHIFQDDIAGVIIDTFHDQQNGDEFFVNPHGVQGDLKRTRNGEDSSYDVVWYSAAHIGKGGWTAEMALPFRSLRFPDAPEQKWGIHILRVRPRTSREQMSWAPIPRDENCLFCCAGTMEGIRGVNRGRNLEVLPYAIASQTGELNGSNDASFNWINQAATGDAGVGVKYGLTPNYTLDATYNPDFSQIEADATQIDANQTFALFYAEKRPFFLEGADMFSSPVNVVYTRSINDPVVAGKFTGKSGPNTVAVMSARDENSPYIVPFEERSEAAGGGVTYSNIFRYKRDILTASYVGLIATDRRQEHGGGSNTTLGADTRIRFSESLSASATVEGSYTVEPNDTALSSGFDDIRFGSNKQYDSFFNGERFPGYAGRAEVDRDGRHYSAQLWYEDYSPTFRAETGFVTANDYRMAGFWNGYTFQLDDNRVLDRIEPQMDGGRKYNHGGQFKDTWIEPGIWVRFKGQTGIQTYYIWSEERFAGVLVPGIRRWTGNVSTNFTRYLSASGYWQYGHSVVRDRDNPRLGDQLTWGVETDLKPLSQIELDLNYDRFILNELNSGPEIAGTYVTRARLTYQFTNALFLRAVSEYVDASKSLSFDPLLSYKINPFTVFFIGSSHNFSEFQDDPSTPAVEVAQRGYRQTDRVFFVKLQYLFRM